MPLPATDENGFTHVARDRLSDRGTLVRCCDGAEMYPMHGGYLVKPEPYRPTPNLKFCPECVRIARILGGDNATPDRR